MAIIKYKNKETGEWKQLTESFNISLESEDKTVYVGDTEPVDPSYRVWYDTSYSPTPIAKCKLDSGEWVPVAGGGGGSFGGGGTTNNADFSVNNVTGWLAKTISYGAECDVAVYWHSVENKLSTGNGTVQIAVNDVLKTSYEVPQAPYGKKCSECETINIIKETEITQCENCSHDLTAEEFTKPLYIPLKKFLTTGTNNVVVTLFDTFGNTRILKFTITAVQLNLKSSFGEGENAEAKKAHTGAIDFRYTPVGEVDKKTVYFKVDGELIATREVTEVNAEKQFIIPAQSHGHHTFEVQFDCIIDGQTVTSNKLFYDIIWYEEGNEEPIVACSFKIDEAESVKQYATVNLPWIAYNSKSQYTEVTISDNFGYSNTRTADRTEQSFAYKATNIGATVINFSVGGKVLRSISFNTVENKIDVNAQTDFLELYLDAKGRSNTDTERDPKEWSYGGIKAELKNFNFGVSDGWLLDENNDTVLRVTGDAEVRIPYSIFAADCKSSGKTIEFEFATRDVLNPNSPIIQCWSGDKGIKITAQEALLKSLQNTVSRQYKENEHIRVSFVIQSETAGHRLIFLYINGVQSACVQYISGDTGDNFKQNSPVGIRIGSRFCTTDIYCIRVYNTYLTSKAILDNWIADTQNIEQKIERYNRNNIFNALGRIDYQRVQALNIPYLVVDAADYSVLPDKEDQEVIISGEYIDPLFPKRNFVFVNATITPQGTSSLRYARKNYKLKLKQHDDFPDKPFSMTVDGTPSDKYALRDTSLPTNTFTFKADVASSEGANNVELAMLYDETCPVKTPPQDKDSRIRQGIEGYPCLIFYRNGSEYYFIGKYNFNNDKGTAEVFGFDENDESWEILLNNDPMCVWKNDDFTSTYYNPEEGKYVPSWTKAFEARYPKKNTNINNLRTLSRWLKSTDTDTASDLELAETDRKIYPVRVTINDSGLYEFKDEETEYTHDTKLYRLAKFRTEFAEHVNVDAMIFNYVFTETFLMVDNRAKNAFPTRYDEDGKWIILPYDYDTAIGINNSGELKFGYWLEDIDNVFNGEGGSVLYTNIRLAFPQEIKAMYQKIRDKSWRDGAFSYEAVEKRFADHQNVWGEAIFNEDAKFKYIDPLVDDGKNDLPKLQGSKASQRQWWLYNRFRYLDSKFNTGDALNDYIFVYAYVKDDIEVSPYADIYATAKFDSTLSSVRALRGNGDTPATYTIKNPFKGETVEEGTDHIITIYSASQLASVGDLSKLKIGGNADFSKGVKLNSLKLGSSVSGYENPNLTHLSIGKLPLLTSFDISNCSNLVEPIDLSGCSNIEEVYAKGTGTTAIALPRGGILKTLHLPPSITSLVIQDQPALTNFEIGSYDNIETLYLENVDFANTFDIVSILDSLKDTASVRLSGFEFTLDTAEDVFALYEKFDRFTTKPQLTGIIHCGRITYSDYMAMKAKYFDITIDYDYLDATVSFVKEVRQNGPIEELTSRVVTIGTNGILTGAPCTNPINDGSDEAIVIPTKEPTEISKFIFADWDNDLQNITENTVVNAQFDEFMQHRVTFKDDYGNIIQVQDTDGVLKDTIIYYNRIGENTIIVPDDREDYEYRDESTGIAYNRYFKGWRNAETKVSDVVNISNNSFEEIEYEAYFSSERIYVIRFIDPYNSAHSVTIRREEGEPIDPTFIDPVRLESENGEFYHHFMGWSSQGANLLNQNVEQPATITGTENLTYYAVYDSITRSYDITVYGIEGGLDGETPKVLYQANLLYGATVYIPTEEERSVVGYTFREWDKEFTTVKGTEIYTALYDINIYKVKFLDWNDSVIMVDGKEVQEVPYNTMPIVPEDPIKAADEQYIYDFDRWDPGYPEPVTKDINYKAIYSEMLQEYPITWNLFDQEPIVEIYKYGETPVVPEIWAKSKEIVYKGTPYPITGVYPEISSVVGEASYVVTVKKEFIASARPTLAGARSENAPDPTAFLDNTGKLLGNSDEAYDIILYGFDFEALNDTGNIDITDLNVFFKNSFTDKNKTGHTFTFITGFNTMGDNYTYHTSLGDNAVTLPAVYGSGLGIDQYVTYESLPKTRKWIQDNLAAFTGDHTNNTFGMLVHAADTLQIRDIVMNITYTCDILAIPDESQECLVTWNLLSGGTVSQIYQIGETPEPPYALNKSYVYDGVPYTIISYTPALTAVSGRQYFAAQYEITKYPITFVDWDGTIREVHNVTWGTMPPAPVWQRDHYTHVGWEHEIEAVTDATVYKAVYEIDMHTVTWNFGPKRSIVEFPYGTKASDVIPPSGFEEGSQFEQEGITYNCNYWPTIQDVTEDVAYTAIISGTGSLTSRFTKIGKHYVFEGTAYNCTTANWAAFLANTGCVGVADSYNKYGILYGFNFKKLESLPGLTITDIIAKGNGKITAGLFGIGDKRLEIYPCKDFDLSESSWNYTSLTDGKYLSITEDIANLSDGTTFEFEKSFGTSENTKKLIEWANTNYKDLINGYNTNSFGVLVAGQCSVIYTLELKITFNFGYESQLVTFFDKDGTTVLKREYTSYGLVPEPPESLNEGYTIVWDKPLSPATETINYVAVGEQLKVYNITWKIANTLIMGTCEHGKVPQPPEDYNINDIISAGNATYLITNYVGYTPNVTTATGDATYIAQATGTMSLTDLNWDSYGVSGGDVYYPEGTDRIKEVTNSSFLASSAGVTASGSPLAGRKIIFDLKALTPYLVTSATIKFNFAVTAGSKTSGSAYVTNGDRTKLYSVSAKAATTVEHSYTHSVATGASDIQEFYLAYYCTAGAWPGYSIRFTNVSFDLELTVEI